MLLGVGLEGAWELAGGVYGVKTEGVLDSKGDFCYFQGL